MPKLIRPKPKHRLLTPETCDCKQSGMDGDCPVCDWGLGVCADCGRAECDLDQPCVPKCKACSGSGKDSRGNPCFPCEVRKQAAEAMASCLSHLDKVNAGLKKLNQSKQAKVSYVKKQRQTRSHHCHWPGCGKQVPPAMWGCYQHWMRLPKYLRDAVWASYQPGQEVNMTPSREYLAVVEEVERWILENG